jgi:hypothetical protein
MKQVLFYVTAQFYSAQDNSHKTCLLPVKGQVRIEWESWDPDLINLKMFFHNGMKSILKAHSYFNSPVFSRHVYEYKLWIIPNFFMKVQVHKNKNAHSIFFYSIVLFWKRNHVILLNSFLSFEYYIVRPFSWHIGYFSWDMYFFS